MIRQKALLFDSGSQTAAENIGYFCPVIRMLGCYTDFVLNSILFFIAFPPFLKGLVRRPELEKAGAEKSGKKGHKNTAGPENLIPHPL